jgi:hypothetical protein
MGDEPVLDSERLTSRYDLGDLMRDRAMSPEVRLANGIRFNNFGSRMAVAGAKARARNARSS